MATKRKKPEEPEVLKMPPDYVHPLQRFYRDPTWLAGYWRGMAEAYYQCWIDEQKRTVRLSKQLKRERAR